MKFQKYQKYWVLAKTVFSDDEEREFEVDAIDLPDAWDRANRQILEGREKIVSVTKEEA